MTTPSLRRPTRRRLTDTLPAAVAPGAAFSLPLGAMATWVAAGRQHRSP
ncbi:hypothetical protein ABZ357_11295 [Streptomyces sp. NPDC005917]